MFRSLASLLGGLFDRSYTNRSVGPNRIIQAQDSTQSAVSLQYKRMGRKK
jgi:hypothetical protein